MTSKNPFLEIDNISKTFKGLVALDNVSFCAQKEEILGIIGPNGAGKTTLFNLISGFSIPDKGNIIFEGKNITSIKPHQISKLGIARTFQIVKPMRNLNVLENVMMGPLAHSCSLKEAEIEAKRVLELLGIPDKSQFLAENLSLPEKKRLEVARALATRPKVLLLDEVMAGLRPSEVDHMVSILKEINKQTGLTILMIEHAMRAVMTCCHRIVVLNYGEKIAEDTPEEVIQHPEVIRSYLGQYPC
ncbi:MAG: ABC transporter ATP-binding protein [Alphaproteobacteria bacterium]|nr:ABC transporter ATP-binding protein [Alphaproteobacteria bacterium]